MFQEQLPHLGMHRQKNIPMQGSEGELNNQHACTKYRRHAPQQSFTPKLFGRHAGETTCY